jgi:hypothetical protein
MLLANDKIKMSPITVQTSELIIIHQPIKMSTILLRFMNIERIIIINFILNESAMN